MIDRMLAMRIFVRIVEARSFIRAANSLGVTPTKATIAVQSLEAILGVQLLVRTTRRVTLTPEGAAYYPRCTQVLSAIDEMECGLFNRPEQLRGRLRVAMPGMIASTIVIPAVTSFHERHPNVELAIAVSNRPVNLLSEDIDCSIVLGDLPDSDLVARRLGTVERVTCASPKYLARRGTPINLQMLSGHVAVNRLTIDAGREGGLSFEFSGRSAKLKLDGLVEVNDEYAYLACGIEGLGLIQPGRFAAAPYLASGQLVEVLETVRPPPLAVSVSYVRSRHMSQRMKSFIDWLAELFERSPCFGQLHSKSATRGSRIDLPLTDAHQNGGQDTHAYS